MSTKISLLILLCLFCLFNLKETKKIYIENEKVLTYVINKKQTFSLELPKNIKLKNLQISIESSNSINQIISFSNSDKECKNSKKYISNKSDFFIDNYQLSNKKKYLCVECALNTYCEFKISFKQNKNKISQLKESKISLKSTRNLEATNNNINFSNSSEINLYALSFEFTSVIKIPSDSQSIYQITGTNDTTYVVSNGSSVGVTSLGTVYPRNTTWYWYGNKSYVYPQKGKNLTKISNTFYEGKSIITILSANKTETTISFNVIDYGILYADKILKNFVINNVANLTSEYEKFEKITSFPAQYPFSTLYNDYVSMVIMQGGDCWASSYTILKLCELAGIKAHLRYGGNEGEWKLHKNVAALIDGKIYIGEAGYEYDTPIRPYNVTEENNGFYLRINYTSNKASLLQYDGFDENIKVPEKIDNYTINEIGNYAFYYGKVYSVMNVRNVELPDTIEIIGNSSFYGLDTLESIKIPKNVKSIGKSAFSNCSKIEKINVDSDNKFFVVNDGILYDYDKTKLLYFPTSKEMNEYNGLNSLLEIDDYAFYYTTKINKLILPEGIKKIGQYAFACSELKEIYFTGPQPEFGIYVFDSVNATVYYPKNKNWDTEKVDISYADNISFVQWEPPNNVPQNDKSNTLVWVIVIIVIVLVLGIVGYILYRKKKKSGNSDSVEEVNAFGKLL